MASMPDRLPLVIGITGHRDVRPEDVPRLEQEVAAILTRLRRDYLGDDGATPLVVLSSLAEGGDRIGARVALAQGARLIAPLPMPADEYRRDFEPGLRAGAAAEFDALLSQADAAPVMPFTPGNSLDAVRSDGGKRAAQYRAAGLFIVQHCNVLIALWDGLQSEAAGGTAEVVTFKRRGIPLEIGGSARASLDGAEIGPVIHVVTPRQREGSPAAAVSVAPWGRVLAERHRGGTVRRCVRFAASAVASLFRTEINHDSPRLSPDGKRELEVWETFETLIALTQEFNRDAVRLSGPGAPDVAARSIDDLFRDPDNKDKTIDEAARAHALAHAPHWCRLYAVADMLAQQQQRRFRWDWRVLFGFALAAFLSLAIYSHGAHPAQGHLFLTGYIVLVAMVYLVFAAAWIGRHQERFLDYRALAEALRVALFWNMLGIGRRWPDDPAGRQTDPAGSTMGALANSYPIKQPSELAWVKVCLRSLESLHGRTLAETTREPDAASHALARRYWVYGQYRYFGRRGVQHNLDAEMRERWGLVLPFVGAFVLAPALILYGEHVWLGLKLHTVLLLAIAAFTGLGAVVAGYAERLAMKAQARQYDRMRMLFERAYELLPETVDARIAPLVQSVYRELGAEAMKEHAEWVAIYRQRPIQPVQQ